MAEKAKELQKRMEGLRTYIEMKQNEKRNLEEEIEKIFYNFSKWHEILSSGFFIGDCKTTEEVLDTVEDIAKEQAEKELEKEDRLISVRITEGEWLVYSTRSKLFDFEDFHMLGEEDIVLGFRGLIYYEYLFNGSHFSGSMKITIMLKNPIVYAEEAIALLKEKLNFVVNKLTETFEF